jgi:hypothetical protein
MRHRERISARLSSSGACYTNAKPPNVNHQMPEPPPGSSPNVPKHSTTDTLGRAQLGKRHETQCGSQSGPR